MEKGETIRVYIGAADVKRWLHKSVTLETNQSERSLLHC